VAGSAEIPRATHQNLENAEIATVGRPCGWSLGRPGEVGGELKRWDIIMNTALTVLERPELPAELHAVAHHPGNVG
jgi:hypothetical protein